MVANGDDDGDPWIRIEIHQTFETLSLSVLAVVTHTLALETAAYSSRQHLKARQRDSSAAELMMKWESQREQSYLHGFPVDQMYKYHVKDFNLNLLCFCTVFLRERKEVNTVNHTIQKEDLVIFADPRKMLDICVATSIIILTNVNY